MLRQHWIIRHRHPQGKKAMKSRVTLLGLLLGVLMFSVQPSMAQTVRVDPAAAAGSATTVPTLRLALAQAQRWRKVNPSAVIRIELAGGLHVLEQSLSLDSWISGTPDHPTTLTSVPGQRAQLALAKCLNRQDFQPITDPALLARLPEEARGKVVSLDLRQHGIQVATPADVDVKHQTLELIVDDKRLPLSSWPNQHYAKMGEVLDRGMPPAEVGGTFRFTDARVLRWQHAMDDGGVWLRGFWRVPWTRQSLRVKEIKAKEQTIQFSRPIAGGIGSKYGTAKKGQVGEESWQAVNLLEEIDQPGEWAVNTRQQRLDVWLPDHIKQPAMLLAARKEPLLRCRNVSHLSIQGLSFVAALGRHIEINAGEDVVVAGCEFRNSGDCAIAVTGGTRHQILANDIAQAGREGVRCYGGERRTLKRSDHRIENNWIHDIGIHAPVPAVVIGEYTRAEAVGMFVRRNRIHDVPNGGIVFAGNDHLIEENEIYRIGLGSNDIGGIYTNSAWTGRGTVIRNNWIHHSPSANGIYMDDGSCGSVIEQNVIWHCATGVFIGGGHDQLVRANVAIRCDRALHVDSRGVSRNYSITNDYYAKDLESVPHDSEPWRSRYPELLTLLAGDTRRPQRVLLRDNVAIACAQPLRLSGKEADFAAVQRGQLVNLSDARDVEHADTMQVTIPREVLPSVADFVAIDTSRLGLRRDDRRSVLPTRDVAALRQLDSFTPFAKKESAAKHAVFDSQIDVDASNRQTTAAPKSQPQAQPAAPGSDTSNNSKAH